MSRSTISDPVATMRSRSASVMSCARAVSTVPTIGRARIPSQTWMTGVCSSLIVARCWAMVSCRAACSTVSLPAALMVFSSSDDFSPREHDSKGAAFSGRALDLDASAMGLDELLHQRESEPQALGLDFPRFSRAIKLLEDALLDLRSHTDPGVVDRRPRLAIVCPTMHRDATAGRRVADGVGEEIPKDAEQRIGIADHRDGGERVVTDQDEALLRGRRLCPRARLMDHFTQVVRRRRQYGRLTDTGPRDVGGQS